MSFLFGETEKTDKESTITENVDFGNATPFQLNSIPESITLPPEQVQPTTQPISERKTISKKTDRKTYNLRATPQREQVNRGEPVYRKI